MTESEVKEAQEIVKNSLHRFLKFLEQHERTGWRLELLDNNPDHTLRVVELCKLIEETGGLADLAGEAKTAMGALLKRVEERKKKDALNAT